MAAGLARSGPLKHLVVIRHSMMDRWILRWLIFWPEQFTGLRRMVQTLVVRPDCFVVEIAVALRSTRNLFLTPARDKAHGQGG